MTRMVKAMHKQAEGKYMIVSVRTGSMVKRIWAKQQDFSLLEENTLVSRSKLVDIHLYRPDNPSDILFTEILVGELTKEVFILSPFSALQFCNFGA